MLNEYQVTDLAGRVFEQIKAVVYRKKDLICKKCCDFLLCGCERDLEDYTILHDENFMKIADKVLGTT